MRGVLYIYIGQITDVQRRNWASKREITTKMLFEEIVSPYDITVQMWPQEKLGVSLVSLIPI